jgi:hypothetical protein
MAHFKFPDPFSKDALGRSTRSRHMKRRSVDQSTNVHAVEESREAVENAEGQGLEDTEIGKDYGGLEVTEGIVFSASETQFAKVGGARRH